MKRIIAALIAAAFAAVAHSGEPPRQKAENVYTLYRSSAVNGGEKWRLHVATFDAADGPEYNRDNCETAKSLFQGQPGVTVTFWCERGYFSKK